MAICPPDFHKGRPYTDEPAVFAFPGFNVCEAAFDYRPRRPEESVLYRTVAENLESFLARRQERGRVVPRFVENDLRDFLDCGILERGFVRVHCDACGKDRVVAFSCKSRSFCPSCYRSIDQLHAAPGKQLHPSESRTPFIPCWGRSSTVLSGVLTMVTICFSIETIAGM